MNPPEQKLVDIDEIVFADNNPKLHDAQALAESEMRYGFVEIGVINATTGKMVAGEGRIRGLRDLKKAGKPAPLGVIVIEGKWKVDARFFPFPDDKTAQAYLIDSNNIGLLGGDFTAFDLAKLWNEDQYVALLQELAEQNSLPVSVSREDVDALGNEAEWGDKTDYGFSQLSSGSFFEVVINTASHKIIETALNLVMDSIGCGRGDALTRICEDYLARQKSG